MSLNTCSKCGKLLFSQNHHCELFKIIDEDGELWEIYAADELEAAEIYAEKTNINGDYWLMNEETNITVNGVKYCVGAEPDVYYTALKIKGD